MPLDLWLAFTAAAFIVIVIPGPAVMLVVAYALSHGRRSAFATITGVALGNSVAVTLAMLGLGAVLAASATAFAVLK